MSTDGGGARDRTALRRAQHRTWILLIGVLVAALAVDPRVLPLARDVAARALRLHQLPLVVGLLLQQAGQVLSHDSTGCTTSFTCLVVLCAVASVRIVVDARRTARFLRAHPAGGRSLPDVPRRAMTR